MTFLLLTLLNMKLWGCKIYLIEVGDYVTFRSNQPKDITRYSPVKYNVPQCLYGLHVNEKEVDRHTEFMVQYLTDTGFIIVVDEFPSGLFFMKNRLQWSSSPIVSESVVNKLSNLV